MSIWINIKKWNKQEKRRRIEITLQTARDYKSTEVFTRIKGEEQKQKTFSK